MGKILFLFLLPCNHRLLSCKPHTWYASWIKSLEYMNSTCTGAVVYLLEYFMDLTGTFWLYAAAGGWIVSSGVDSPFLSPTCKGQIPSSLQFKLLLLARGCCGLAWVSCDTHKVISCFFSAEPWGASPGGCSARRGSKNLQHILPPICTDALTKQ